MTVKRMFLAAAVALTAGVLFCGSDVCAQNMPAFFKKNNAKKDRGDLPTIIESATMDVDLENNRATLIGNVVVDDPSMKIVCNKMIIYLEDTEETPADARKDGKKEAAGAKDKADVKEGGKKEAAKTENTGKDAKKEEEDEFSGDGKKLKKVECYGDVVITNKADPNDPKAKDQVATSDFALYDLATDTVTLTGKPVLSSGTDRLNCEKIIFDLNTGRTKILEGKITTYGDFQKNKK